MTEELKCLGLSRKINVLTNIPKEDDLQEIWPAGRAVPFRSLFWLPAKLDAPDIGQGTGGSKLETGNLGQGTGDRELGAGNWGRELGGRELGAANW